MQSPHISGTSKSMTPGNTLQTMLENAPHPEADAADDENYHSNSAGSSAKTVEVKNGHLRLPDHGQISNGNQTASSSIDGIGETSTESHQDAITGPLHVQITNVSCAEREATDESSGCGGMVSTSTSSTGHDSQNESPRNMSSIDVSCPNATKINGNGDSKKIDPPKDLNTPELAAIAPPTGTECIASIANAPPPISSASKSIRLVSLNSSASGECKKSQHHKPIIKGAAGTASVTKPAVDAKTVSDADDMNPTVPLAFTVDVVSALDQVLGELESDKRKMAKESGSDKNRPCVLQQTSVVDMISSGTTTPSPDEQSIESGTVEDPQSAVRVKSSMLVCEESLAAIAQMTAPPKHGLVKISHPLLDLQPKSVVLEEKSIEVQNTKIKSTKKNPMISGTAAAQFDTIARKVSVGIPNGVPTQALPDRTTEPPSEPILISKPLAPPPQLTPSVSLSAKSKPHSPAVVNHNSNQVMVAGSAREQDMKRTEKGMDMLADITLHAAPILNSKSAAKMATSKKNGELHHHDHNDPNADANFKVKKATEQNMVPIGQSLSVYAAIAAQAGVTAHQPVPMPAPLPTPPEQHLKEQEQELVQSNPEMSSAMPQHTPESAPLPTPAKTYIREIGKIRRFCATTGEFSEWEDLPCQTYGDAEPRRWCELNIDESIEVPLRRGGRLRVFPNFVADGRRSKVSQSMDKCTLHRQYSKLGDENNPESRVQVLLSSKTNRMHSGQSKRGRPGYNYDGVTLMAQPLSLVPQVERLGRDLAELYRLPGNEWNIGANLVNYRTGNDHMAWNSNCEQHEVLILCIIADSQNCTRPILIRPKGHDPLQEGDEEIIVFVGQGDAYEMDGQMQLSYEHCIPKKEDDMSAKRSVVIFRHGKPVSVQNDTGVPIFSEPKNTNSSGRVSSVKVGHPVREICEGKEVFTKAKLIETGAHKSDKKNINGTLRDGCDSILVENQDPMLREDDGLCWLHMTCSKSLGGGALCQSYHNKSPVRVFRSSELQSRYAPALYEDDADTILYRYDGLYAVKAMWDTQGKETTSAPPNDGSQHTFFLTRYPKRPVDGNFEEGMHYNKISIHELWNEIQKRSGVRKPRLFQVPQPFMEHAPIGDESNVSRRRKENIKLPSEENLKTRRLRRKRKSASSPDFDDENRHTIPISAPNRLVSRNGSYTDSDSDSGQDSQDEEMLSEEESDAGTSRRPKRASATAARSFLQKAMLNKYEVRGNERPTRKRRPSIKVGYAMEQKQIKKPKVVANNDDMEKSDMSDDESSSNSAEELDEKRIHVPDEIGSNVEEEVSNIVEPARTLPSKPQKKAASTAQKPKRPNKKVQAKKRDSASGDNGGDESNSVATGKKNIDPTSIHVGYRVNVEYRDVLYKATVKRIREKEGLFEYQIHYDGNKKTNLRWIQHSMVNDIISKVVPQDAKHAAKKCRKTAKVQKEAEEEEEEEVAKDKLVKKEVEIKAEPEVPRKFQIGSEIYAEYRTVLYSAIIRKSRVNRKGDIEYLVHYDGFKKAADRWVKEDALQEIDSKATEKFKEQRSEMEIENLQKHSHNKRGHSNASVSVTVTNVGKRRTRGGRATVTRNDLSAADNTLDMGDHDSGVEFLPGSCVFVVRRDALYLAKMMKRKKVGKSMDYLVHFENSSSAHDTWVPLSSVYEINPKTRRIFDRTEDKREDMNDEDDEEEKEGEEEPTEDNKKTVIEIAIASPTRISSRRTSRKPAKYGQEDDDEEEAPATIKTNRAKKTAKAAAKTTKPADMTGIDSGCDFLPGSTIFVLWNNSLFLAKMLKRRGKGYSMEYLVNCDGFGKVQDLWLNVSSVYEINPQTKRAFNKQKKK